MALPSPTFPDDAEIRRSVGRAVRVVMTARGITGKALAAILPGLTESTLSERLSGKTAFRAEELFHIATVLDVSVGTFFQEPDELIHSRCYAENLPDWPVLTNPNPVQRTLDDELRAHHRPLALAR